MTSLSCLPRVPNAKFMLHSIRWNPRSSGLPPFALSKRHIQKLTQIHKSTPYPPLAFIFDIDGVLIRGPDALPGAKRALDMLDGRNPLGSKIPYLLLTNGGGIGEQERCHKLTQQLGVQIQPSQYLQAHTILTEELAQKYADQPVLVLGGKLDKVRQVAESYGFTKAYTTLDVMAWNPSVWPLHQLTPAELASARRDIDFSQTPISAVFVFHDPRNWGLDAQIICDVLQSGGTIGASSGVQHQRMPVELVFCNPDLIWRSEFPLPRLGQGAFKKAFQAVYKATTGSRAEYPCIQYGKPTRETSSFAERVLAKHLKDNYGADGEFPHIFMVGDNPESDIAGANLAGWSSILVRTGVFDPRQGPPSHMPTHEAEDVEEAVRWALDRELRKANDPSASL